MPNSDISALPILNKSDRPSLSVYDALPIVLFTRTEIRPEFGLKNDLNSTVIRKVHFSISVSVIKLPAPGNVIEIPETDFLEKTED